MKGSSLQTQAEALRSLLLPLNVVTAIMNGAVQLNYTSISVAIVLMEKLWGSVPTWSTSLLSSVVFSGSILGMLVFGVLGDALGRARAMSLTILVVAVSAVASGLCFMGETEQVLWISVWRFLLGMGIGGIYPTTAASSFEAKEASTSSESASEASTRTAWSLFWQQPGQLLTYVIALFILYIFGSSSYSAQYRLMLISGALPCVVVLPTLLTNSMVATEGGGAGRTRNKNVAASLHKVLSNKASRKHLLGAACCWMLFDFYIYGLSLYSPEVIEAIFGSSSSLEDTYYESALSIIVTIPPAAISAVVLTRVGSRRLQVVGYIIAATSFVLMGMSWTYLRDDTVILFLIFLLLKAAVQFGVPTTSFCLPNELFDTSVRSTCNGISAAAGKVGAFVGAFVFPYIYDGWGMAPLFYVCAGVAMLGLLMTLLCIPPWEATTTPPRKMIATTGIKNSGAEGTPTDTTPLLPK